MPAPFDLVGGRPCLDFANTVGGDRFHAPREILSSYTDLLAFAGQAGLLGAAQAKSLQERALRDPRAAAQALERARQLRESIFRIFWALGSRKKPAPGDLAVLNRTLSAALGHREIAAQGGSYALSWKETGDLDRPIWPIATSAADLLAETDRAPIRMCGLSADDECTWIFLDETKNRSRRWCSMKDCGNRAKARRHYHRARAS
jgi:predicted RNA-binding Zn ribbon-like protein